MTRKYRNKHHPDRPSHVVRCGCGRPAKCVRGKDVYTNRPDLAHKFFWVCDPCDARVGCHPGTQTPTGNLATEGTRKARTAAHKAFDPLWKASGTDRNEAYVWLANQLGISANNCHIGRFDEDMCNRVIEVCRDVNVWTFSTDS